MQHNSDTTQPPKYVKQETIFKKLINQSKKKWKFLFKPNLKIITLEEHLRKLWELSHPLEVKAQLCEFFEREGLYN